MPWEKQPAWLYLPHQTDAQLDRSNDGDGISAGQAVPGKEAAEETSKAGHREDDEGGHGGGQRRGSVARVDGCAEDPHGANSTVPPSMTIACAGSGGVRGGDGAAGNPRVWDGGADGIRGQNGLPGGHSDSSGVNVAGRRLIRGQRRLPGEGSSQGGGALSVNEGGEEVTASCETRGQRKNSRARDRETQRWRGIQRSLEAHAERVEDKRRRLGEVPPLATPAERMAALRERIASKRRGGAAGPSGAGASASAATYEAHHSNAAYVQADEHR